MLWGFIRRYAPAASPEENPFLDSLVGHAIAYYRDFVRPSKRYRHPDTIERAGLADLAETLRGMPTDADAEALQTLIYDVGNAIPSPICGRGSAAFIRCCWGSRKVHASAVSLRCTEWRSL